ncbi:MAG: hypothetical protein ABIR34_09515 [Marmoricola sp.]
MNDDNTSSAPGTGDPAAGTPRRRTAAVAAAVGVAGLVAGGLAAGAISAASADSNGAGGQQGYGAARGYDGPGGSGGDPSRPMRSDEKLLTGTTKAKVLAAVKATYPDATVQRVETDSDGVYEAHVLNDGKPLIVQVGKDFKITGTQSGPAGHGGGPGGERGGVRPAPPTGAENPGYPPA